MNLIYESYLILAKLEFESKDNKILIDWAINLIENGIESYSLFLLASSEFDSSNERLEYFWNIMKELNIEIFNQIEFIREYYILDIVRLVVIKETSPLNGLYKIDSLLFYETIIPNQYKIFESLNIDWQNFEDEDVFHANKDEEMIHFENFVYNEFLKYWNDNKNINLIVEKHKNVIMDRDILTKKLQIYSKTTQLALDAYGGIDNWQNFKYIEAEISVSGLVFAKKRKDLFNHFKIKLEITKPSNILKQMNSENEVHKLLTPFYLQLIENKNSGKNEFTNLFNFMSKIKSLFIWTNLDIATFLTYTLGNLITFPYLLINKEINWKEKQNGILEAQFPINFLTNSKIQKFYFKNKTGFLLQHNFKFENICNCAKVINEIKEHKHFGQILFPSWFQIYPNYFGIKFLKNLILVDVKIHNFKFTNEES